MWPEAHCAHSRSINAGALAATKATLDPANLPQARRDHPRLRVLQLPRAGAEEGAGRPHRGARSLRFLAQIIADLDSLTETEIEHDGKRFVIRSAPRPAASLALRAAGVALPPTVREAAAR